MVVDVAAWRKSELERASYTTGTATKLSERGDINLHTAITIHKQGCPGDTALAILL